MPKKKTAKTAVAVCIQEPTEDGSRMDLGAIQGDDLRFLHQAFITDTVINALRVDDADVRMYYIDEPERARLVKIISEYITKRNDATKAAKYRNRFSLHGLERARWGIRAQQVFDDCFKSGYRSVLLIGSRTPTFTTPMMKMALKNQKRLNNNNS